MQKYKNNAILPSRFWKSNLSKLIMKLQLILWLCATFVFAAKAESVFAQKVSLDVKNQPLANVFKQIREGYQVDFLYTKKQLKDTKPITLRVVNKDLNDVLHTILESQGLTYEREGSTVVIKEKEIINRSSSRIVQSVQQEHVVTGKITDNEGNPLLGVSIELKERSQIGTTTDRNGMYVLTVPQNSVLIYRYMGYLTQEININIRRELNVTMQVDVTGMEEIVVVGFGEQKKESLVSSVSTIRGESLRMPNRSLSNNLVGQLSGLIAVQRSGEPGYDNAEFWIRGVSSFAGGTSPLVLVDGVPRAMNDIEPDEIETFTLLKDAAATSVYGSEGANGVVLITSKRGRIQKTSISYRGEASRLTPTRVPRFANSYDYLKLYNERLTNSGKPELFSEAELNKYRSGEDPDLYPSTDWYAALMREHTSNTRHTLNFRGGGDRMKFFVSGAYFGETGLFKVHDEYNNNSNLNRYNLRTNVDIDLTKSTLLRIDLSGQYLQANRPRVSTELIFRDMYSTPPHMVPAVYSDGTVAQYPNEPLTPYSNLVESGYRKEWRSGIQSRIHLEQKLDFLTEGLKIRGAMSYDANSIYFMSRVKTPETYWANGRDGNGALIFEPVSNGTVLGEAIPSSSGSKQIYLEGGVDYNRTFDRHILSGMLLYYQKEEQPHNIPLAYRKQAYIGRGTYNFDNRYILEGNFSVTGSEKFAPGFRYGFFPAVGLAWNITNEPYFPSEYKDVVSGLKLRASIGRTGNDNTMVTGNDRFLYRPTITMAPYGYRLGMSETAWLNTLGVGYQEGRFEAPQLSWEIEVKRNYGIDLSLFNGKIDLQADYFNNHRSNILLQRRTVSAVAGFNEAPWQNFGQVGNKGVDGSLNIKHTVGQVDLALRGNFTFARNKILEYDEIPQLYPWMAVTGTRLNAYGGIVAERLFTEDDFIIGIDGTGKKTYTLRDGIAYFDRHPNPSPGDIKYKDQNGDGIVDVIIDRVRDLSHPTIPEIIYGFGLNATYKGIYASAFLQGAENVSISLTQQVGDRSVFYVFDAGITRTAVRQEVIDSRWTVDNPRQDVFYPRLADDNSRNTHVYENSTWWHRDASYLRLKNVELGYTFPKKVSQKAKMSVARVYVMGQNVALWDKVKVADPEIARSGGAVYPISSVWTAGLEVSF